MKRPDHVPTFSKALLSGALTGLAVAVLNIIYNVIFRGITRYLPSEEFNIVSIALGSVIILMLLGMLFFLFIKYVNVTAFVIAVIILIIGCICITAFVHANPSEPAFYGNHGLIAGFLFISGLLALTLMPYLYNHPKLYI